MKKYTHSIICSLIFLFFFSLTSCKKNSTTDTNQVNDPSVLKLKKAHIDEGSYITDEAFTYNADNTVSERKDSTSELQGGTLHSYEIWNSFFFYNSGDDKPVKDSTIHTAFILSTGFATPYTTTSYYYYDTQNRLIKTESFVAGVLVYTKLNTYLSGQSIDTYDLGTIYHIIDTLSINAQSQLTELRTNVAFTGSDYTDKDLFTFNSKKNPYNDLNITKYGTRGTDTAYASFGGISEYITGPNNTLVDSSFTNSSGSYDLRTVNANTYTYNADNYPTAIIRQENDFYNGIPSGSNTVNISYEYY